MGNALVWPRHCWKGCANWSNVREFKIPRRRRPRKRHSKSEFALFQTPVVVVQWRQRNVQKSVVHVLSCCFAYSPIAFLTFSLSSPSWHLKVLIVALRYGDRGSSWNVGSSWLKSLTRFKLCATILPTTRNRVCKRTQHVTANNVASARGFTSGNDMLTSHVKRLLSLWLYNKSRLSQL